MSKEEKEEEVLKELTKRELVAALALSREENCSIEDALLRQGWYPVGSRTFTKMYETGKSMGKLTIMFEGEPSNHPKVGCTWELME